MVFLHGKIRYRTWLGILTMLDLGFLQSRLEQPPILKRITVHDRGKGSISTSEVGCAAVCSVIYGEINRRGPLDAASVWERYLAVYVYLMRCSPTTAEHARDSNAPWHPVAPLLTRTSPRTSHDERGHG